MRLRQFVTRRTTLLAKSHKKSKNRPLGRFFISEFCSKMDKNPIKISLIRLSDVNLYSLGYFNSKQTTRSVKFGCSSLKMLRMLKNKYAVYR